MNPQQAEQDFDPESACEGVAQPHRQSRLAFVSNRKRSCTDVLCTLLYASTLVGVLVVTILAAQQGGDPARITHGINWRGETCGRSGSNVSLQPYSAWVAYPSLPAVLASPDDCADCSQVFTCLHDCNETLTDAHILHHYPSKSFLYFCIPQSGAVEIVSSEFTAVTSQASRTFVDLYTSRFVLLGAVLIATAISFVYLWLQQRLAGVVVVGGIVLALAGAATLTTLLLVESVRQQRAESAAAAGSSRYLVLRVLGILCGLATLCALAVLWLFRRQIASAIRLVQVASEALMALPYLSLFPLGPILVGVGNFVVFVVVTVLVASVWTLTPRPMPAHISNHAPLFADEPTFQHITWNQNLKNTFALLLVHTLWTSQCLIYFTYMVVSATVARRYFLRQRRQRVKDGATPRQAAEAGVRVSSNDRYIQDANYPVLESVCTALRFHVGTIAFGALVLPVLKVVRAIAEWNERQLKKHEDGGGKFLFCLPNAWAVGLFRCLGACFGCCGTVLRFINQYAFIWTAVCGDGFVRSTDESFQMVWTHLGDVAVTSMVGWCLMGIGKLCIACASTALCAGILYSSAFSAQLSSPALPLAVIFLETYFVAACFLTVLETSIDATFFSILLEERAQGKHLNRQQVAEVECEAENVMKHGQ